jgi:hypothetical protein
LADPDQLAPASQSRPVAPDHVTVAASAGMAESVRENAARAAVRRNGLERDFMVLDFGLRFDYQMVDDVLA